VVAREEAFRASLEGLGPGTKNPEASANRPITLNEKEYRRRNPEGLILPRLTGFHTFSMWTLATKSDFCVKLCRVQDER
jgi:hypothetical protein